MFSVHPDVIAAVAGEARENGAILHIQIQTLRSPVPRDHPVASVQQLRVAREISAVKRPVGMIMEFFIPLVEAVGADG